jgi:ubiquinone/menaquinone biosynthesis C-methylase UbiE
MERILEPEYMDTRDEAEGYAAMDNTAANRSIVDYFLSHGGGGRTLDIGTGPGDIPIMLAQREPRMHLAAVDAAAQMLSIARARIAQHGLSRRIALQRCDAKELPFADGAFDAVLSNTILHHIPDPVAFLAEAARVCKRDGVLVIRDLYRPPTEAAAWQIVDEHAAGAPREHRQLLFDSLHAALELHEARAAARAAGLADARVEMTSDRHYTILRAAR